MDVPTLLALASFSFAFGCVACCIKCSGSDSDTTTTNSTQSKKKRKKSKKKARGDLSAGDARYSVLSIVSTLSSQEPLLLNSPLATPTPLSQVRAQSSFRHAAEGVNTCAFCGFENLQRFLFCRLCTRAIAPTDSSTGSSSTNQANLSNLSASNPSNVVIKKTHVNEKSVPSRAIDRRERQLRAKLRRQWVRKIDVSGELYWYRGVISKGSRSDDVEAQLSRGHVPFFTKRAIVDDHEEKETQKSGSSSPPLTKEVFVESLNKSAESVQLEFVETSKADPMRLPVQDENAAVFQDDDEDTPVAENSYDVQVNDSLRETLAMASTVGFLTKFAHFAKTAENELVVSKTEQLVRFTVSHDDAQVLDDSMELLAVIPRESVRCVFDVHFIDLFTDGQAHERYEEWLALLDDALADPASGVFRQVGRVNDSKGSSNLKQERSVYLNSNSLRDIGEHHLPYYFAAGRFIGRAMLEGYTLSFHLALPLLKMMLGLPLSLGDLEYVDPANYRRVVEVLSTDNDGDLEKQELHFSMMEKLGDEEFVTVDLIPNGRHIAVTNSNKHEYVDRVFKYALFERVSSQLYAFLRGFSEVIPKELLLLFDPEELDYVLCESHEINVVGLAIRRKKNKKKSKRKQRRSSGSFSEVGEMLLESGMVAIEVAALLG